jgi:2-amino-4-hydroxy-6-hydroxymethyldihydropteridine diphosphokinase
MTEAHLIALGANLGTPARGPRETLEAALEALGTDGVTVLRRSRWYRTPAFPPGSGPDFVNGAAVLASDLAPEALLGRLHAVEAAMGRARDRRWEPRLCDLDLVASGTRVLPDAETVRAWIARTGDAQLALPPGLILPHPRLQDRGFVLRPLADVAPDWRHPVIGRTIAELLAALPAEALAGIAPL